ncbi:hypothetical protein FRX31_012693 [Thalictrum thalictroides]|uniref:Uncharacterized protein n=1 Tax=Thalictrum thalictroides TaxID=46969 RepID=A0A7J6WM90_THATH|nr:hypothetical protein FRX31_012693 [Thalictrum thalictroides]
MKTSSSISFLHMLSVKILKEFTGYLIRFHTLDRDIAIKILKHATEFVSELLITKELLAVL